MVGANAAKTDLMALRDRYLRELVKLARDQAAAEQKLNDILALERAIAVVQPPSDPQKYGGFKRAIDAILDYLDEQGKAVDLDKLADVVVERGFRAPNPGARAIVLKSVAAYLHGEAGRKREVIKKVGKLIGRSEWPDEMFGQEG